MRKLYTIALAFICISIEAVAQPMSFMPKLRNDVSASVIDSGNIKITYILNQSEKDSNKSDDIHILEIGQKLSKYYSYNLFQTDSLRADFAKRNPNAGVVPLGSEWKSPDKYFWSGYYKDYKTNEITEYAYMPGGIPNYQYSEIIDFDWQIQEETSMVASYLCQRATCSFRGKNYTAWFSPDISISNGPWKFGGLPGLILKVYDDRNDYVFECIGIENHKTRFPITSYYDHRNYTKIERKKLLKLWGDIFDHYCQILGWSSDLFKNSKSPYKPIELE